MSPAHRSARRITSRISLGAILLVLVSCTQERPRVVPGYAPSRSEAESPPRAQSSVASEPPREMPSAVAQTSEVDSRVRARRPSTDSYGGSPNRFDHRSDGLDAPERSMGDTYAHVEEHRFTQPAASPLSTFAIDVDTASYANVRRMIDEGRRPPADAVRIEELINYFSYDDPAPTDGSPFAVRGEMGPCPWDPSHALMRVSLRARGLERNLPARNLVLLVDVSGSMQSDDKLPLVVRGLERLTEELREQDRIAIVVYAGAEGVALPTTRGSDRERIRRALSSLSAGGSTNGGAGIQLAYQLARNSFVEGGVNRVILATDGDFNVGITSQTELVRLIEHEREAGVYLTVLGVGTGNLRDSTMESLADRGNGNYAYLDSLDEAERVLVREASSTLVTVARDVKIQVEMNPDRVRSYRLVGYENRALTDADWHDDRADAGELGADDSVVALYELTLADEDDRGDSLVDDVRRFANETRSSLNLSSGIATIKTRFVDVATHRRGETITPVRGGVPSFHDTSEDFRFTTAVVAFGLVIRGSDHAGDVSFALARSLAAGSLGTDLSGERRGFLRLIDRAASL